MAGGPPFRAAGTREHLHGRRLQQEGCTRGGYTPALSYLRYPMSEDRRSEVMGTHGPRTAVLGPRYPGPPARSEVPNN